MKDLLHGVPDESETSTFGLTKKELKQRLKHIAGLCYALCCDISNTEFEAEYLRRENAELREQLKARGVKVPHLKKKLHAEIRKEQLTDK